MKIPVEGQPGFYRDSETGAIINTSSLEYSSYEQTKKIKLKEKEEIEQIKNDLAELKGLMKDIVCKLTSQL